MKTVKKKTKAPDLSNLLLMKLVKITLFVLLVAMLITVVYQSGSRSGRIIWISAGISLGLIGSFLLRTLVIKTAVRRIPFYVFDLLLLVFLTFLIKSTLLSTLFLIVMSDFYFDFSFRQNVVMGVAGFVSYVLPMVITTKSPIIMSLNITELFTMLVGDLIIFLLDFVIINLSVTVLRRNYEIEKNLELVHRRERKLKEAYDMLEEVTILEERNRIAKEIHDTTGHSITTIIMQTEAAKLIIDKNPAEAKSKIISANLQAVTALEELRRSVKTLSGSSAEFDLYESLNKTIEETTSGTGISIRSKIDQIRLPENIGKFLSASFKEGLNNGIRHGKSTAFYFELKATQDKLYFLLSDNGCGVNLDSLNKGFGLDTMIGKTNELGGDIHFISQEGDGFEINITFPLPPQKPTEN